MTEEEAKQIRKFRCEDGGTWRAVALRAHKAQICAHDWEPPSNQIAGLELCRHAAALLGENPWKDPWN